MSEIWEQCRVDWLNQAERKSGRGNTRRAYEADMRGFLEFCGQRPGDVTAAHAEAWAQALAQAGQAPATINRKLSALSSFYRYADEYPGLGPLRNPFASRTLRNRHSSQPVAFPTPEQIDDLLCAIPTGTATGLRNLALIAGLIATTRRINEMLSLRGGDIEHVARRLHWITYRCKGGATNRQQLPDQIWQITETYLRRAERWPLADSDYLYVALSDNGDRLHPDAGPVGCRPLNSGYVARLIMRYGVAAGIPEQCLYPHALRHAGTELRHEAGEDLIDLQKTLGHRNPATTISYLRRLERPVDRYAETIGERLTRRLNLPIAR